MTRRTVIALGLALVFGIAAAVGVRSLAQPRGSDPDTVPVVVAAVDMPKGTKLTKDLLVTKDWPQAHVPAGAYTSVDDAVDRCLKYSVVKDDPMVQAKATEKGAAIGIEGIIKEGMRAYTIATPDAASGVAGFISPGANVDVMLTVTDRMITEKAGGGSTVTLLQNIEVLAVNSITDNAGEQMEGDKLRSVTLEVLPKDAEKLSLAQTKGTLHLSMRNNKDDEAADTCPVTMRELQFMEDEDGSIFTSVRRRAKPIRIMTFRGNSASYVYVRPELPPTPPTPPSPDEIASAAAHTPVPDADQVQ